MHHECYVYTRIRTSASGLIFRGIRTIKMAVKLEQHQKEAVLSSGKSTITLPILQELQPNLPFQK